MMAPPLHYTRHMRKWLIRHCLRWLVAGGGFTIRPDRRYLLLVDPNYIHQETTRHLMDAIDKWNLPVQVLFVIKPDIAVRLYEVS